MNMSYYRESATIIKRKYLKGGTRNRKILKIKPSEDKKSKSQAGLTEKRDEKN